MTTCCCHTLCQDRHWPWSRPGLGLRQSLQQIPISALLLHRLSLLCSPGNQQGVLEHHLQHGGRVRGGGKPSSAGEVEVDGKGGVGGAGSDVHQFLVLLILEELAVGAADLELGGGADAQRIPSTANGLDSRRYMSCIIVLSASCDSPPCQADLSETGAPSAIYRH